MRFLPALLLLAAATFATAAEKPLFRDFAGLCVHTVSFKPAVYTPVTKLLRDYHPIEWDLGNETDSATTFPMARNKVDWSQLYGSWKKAGYRTEASIMFDNFDAKAWKDLPRDAHAYGQSFAAYFGPSNKDLIEAIEIGNEPGKYDDATYRTLFEAMASGARAGDPKLRIATCAANLGPSGRYSKSVDLLTGLENLYDIVNIHIYPEVEGWPTWRRSYPEDPKIEFRQHLAHVLQWRAEHAPTKEVWLTEFGYDASSQPTPTTGTFAKWVGSTETEQALWTVRAYLILAASGVDRAYLFYFNDTDEPHVHGSSGLTRNYQPKPAFHAVAHLQSTLGDYRFVRAQKESDTEGYVYEFANGADPKRQVWVAWNPSPGAAPQKIALATGALHALQAERTPLKEGPAQTVALAQDGGTTSLEITNAPAFVFLEQ